MATFCTGKDSLGNPIAANPDLVRYVMQVGEDDEVDLVHCTLHFADNHTRGGRRKARRQRQVWLRGAA
jgi:hypothetical protein